MTTKPSHRLVALAAVAAAVTSCGGTGITTHSETDASWANAYPTVAAMGQHADVIVVGRVTGIAATGVDTFTGTAQGVPYTDYDVLVTRWVAGTEASRTVRVHQSGVRHGANTEGIRDDPLLTVGEQDVLFLHRYMTGRYNILGGPTGRFPVKANVVTALSGGIARDGVPQSLATFSTRARTAHAQGVK